MRYQSGKAVLVMAILVLYNLSIHPTNKAIIEFVLVNRSSPKQSRKLLYSYQNVFMYLTRSTKYQYYFSSVHVCLVQGYQNDGGS